MTPHIDVDVPPPPYSETDIYSTSAGRSPIMVQSPTRPVRLRTASHNSPSPHDDASSASSNSEVIYTPPLTPHSSHSNVQPVRSPNSAGSNNGILSPGYPNDPQSSASVASDHLTSASAEAYFESRPVAAGVDSSRVVHHVITVRPGSSPMDFPYQQEWATRDIRQDDWQTFLNYLLPNHGRESNEDLIDRKLRAEGIKNDGESRSAQSEKDGGRSATSTSPVIAQLEQLRLEEQPSQNMNYTVHEWNEGFFAPRGMIIHLEQTPSVQVDPRMPGSWDQSFNNTSPGLAQQPGSGSRWWRSLPRFESSNGRLRFGGVSIDNDRISIGDSFVADSRGLRIGGLVADDRGLSLHGRDLFGAASQRARGQPSAPPGLYDHPPMPPMPSMTAIPPMPMAPGHNYPHPAPPSGFEGRAERHRHHHSQERERGRGRGYPSQGISRHRSSSSASSSSSSSSSSSDSNSSIGSLPDYNDLKDSQIPVARSYLQDWLAHPDNVVSKATVKEAKESIKAAAKQQNQNAAAAGGMSTSARTELHAMFSQWERVKRQQKSARRQLRKERRAARKAEKRERRQTRREARQSRREAKREGREARREARRERRGGGPSRHRSRGGCHDRGFGPAAHPPHHHRSGLGRGDRPHGPFGGHHGFPGAGLGPGARRGGAFPFECARGGAFQPPAAVRGPWSVMNHARPWDHHVQGVNQSPPNFPGAWPDDDDDHDNNNDDDNDETHGQHQGSDQDAGMEKEPKRLIDPYATSKAMYRELDAKTALLQDKRKELSALTGEQAQSASNEKESEPAEKAGASILAKQLAELEELELEVNRLSIDADEQYAKELVRVDEFRESLYAAGF